jgi:hypothetical protein
MFAFLSSALIAVATINSPALGDDSIRTVPVDRTPEPQTVALKIAVPKRDEKLQSNPVWIQFRIDGYSLGSNSQFERAEEIFNSDLGQTVHVVIDDEPYFPVNEPALDPYSEGGFYYNMSYKFEVPFDLKEGRHTIRMFPARSFGESLKGENAFFATEFQLGNSNANFGIDLSKPYLTYNEPSEYMHYDGDKPILLDFYVTNTELSADGYKVRLSIDGKAHRILSSWQPYYIYDLKKGKHKIRLELLDENKRAVPGSFNDVERTIVVY